MDAIELITPLSLCRNHHALPLDLVQATLSVVFVAVLASSARSFCGTHDDASRALRHTAGQPAG